MFIEKLTCEQKKDIAKKICKHLGNVYRYSVDEYYLDDELYMSVFVYDYDRGNYPISIFDTYVQTSYIRDLKLISDICAKELYKIFGEEYKDYYMQQVNSIFNN